MAREISPACGFIFGSIHTCLPTGMVEVELTIRSVKGIYPCCKDLTVESTSFTLWSKAIIPFPSLRQKIWTFKDDNAKQAMMPWNNGSMPQFSAPCKPYQNSRKCAAGKIRMRWLNCNNQFNLIKINRCNTLGTKQMDMNKIDMIQPIPTRACKCFGPTCSYCKYEAPHPSQVHSDWSSEDWDGDKAKAKEQMSLINFEPPKADSYKELTDQLTNVRKVILVDDMPFQNLTIG